MRIDRYVHDERLTWGAGSVLLAITAIHLGGIGKLLTAPPPDYAVPEGQRLFQVTLERLPPPPLPKIEEKPEPVPAALDQPTQAPRKTRPVPILIDTPTEHPVPPDTQVKQYVMGDEKLEGEPGPPSPPGAEVGGTDDSSRPPPMETQWKIRLRVMKPPVYPPKCLRMGIEGVVKVRVLVGENGAPQEISLAKSSGDSSLDEAALRAVKDWIFEPAMRDGLPVRAWAVVPVAFKLID